VQLLFSTGKSFTVDGLREKLREFYSDKVRAEVRDLAALNNVKLITALLSRGGAPAELSPRQTKRPQRQIAGARKDN
jgi:hypothetical protein